MSKLAEVSLKLEHKRYFTNPFVGNPTELAKIVTDEWIKEKVDKLAKRLIEQEIKDEDCKKDDEGNPLLITRNEDQFGMLLIWAIRSKSHLEMFLC
uniref:Uncharacterized protein n=1 Tax=Acrobeloides nanus TaxID=290746 RepID=A0A914E5F9_9BILA